MTESSLHSLSFRGLSLPPGTAWCERCERVITIEQFLDERCPGVSLAAVLEEDEG